MDMLVEQQGKVNIIRLNGRLDGTTMQLVEQKFLELVSQGNILYIFDFCNLDYISSAGLRVMLLAVKKTRSNGGKVALFGLSDNVYEVFTISGFSTIFPILSSSDEALQYVSS